jgi:hypothetical protein
MNAERLSGDTAIRHSSQHEEARLIFSKANFHHFSSFSPPKEKAVQPRIDKDNSLEKRVWDLVASYGVEKTYQLLLNEGKHVSLEEVFRIANKRHYITSLL